MSRPAALYAGTPGPFPSLKAGARAKLRVFSAAAPSAGLATAKPVAGAPSMPLIYRKTAKGVSEIETRAHKLAPRLRSALIMVDGKRTDDELRALILQQPVETVAWLLENGFIDVLMRETVAHLPPGGPITVATTVSAPPPPPVQRPTPSGNAPLGSSTGGPGAAGAAGAAAALGPTLEARRREGLRLLMEQLGPAGESVAVRIEKARNLDELRAALSAGAQALSNIRGRDAAVAFVARFSDL